jgi:predicted Zn-dependent protease
MKRRLALHWGCAQCAALAAGGVAAQSGALPQGWTAPARFTRPDAGTDEGGLWALLDREETRLRRSPFRIREAELQNYLNGLAAKLAGEHAPDVRVYALFTPMFNASMAPNGMLQLWSGLLLRMENEAQLAAVVGHEIGHYLQRHTVERLRDFKARSAFGQFLGIFGIVGLVAQLATLASAFGFSRDQERDADTVGAMLMRRSGYDPREAGKVWANLVEEMQAAGDATGASGGAMFATHPGASERAAALQTLTAGEAGGFLGEAEYAAALAPIRMRLLEDEVRRNRPAESLVLLTRMLARQPTDPELLLTRAELYRLRAEPQDTDLALADLQAAAQTGREPAATHRALGQIHHARGQRDLARTAYRNYLQRDPAAPDAALVSQALEELQP